MAIFYYIAALLIVFIGVAHSYLGERYLLIRLFRKQDLPTIFGSVEFSRRTLRFAWHLTTLCWFGFAAILIAIAKPGISLTSISLIVAVTFSLHFAVALIASRGRHLSWIVFLLISGLLIFAIYR